MKIKKRFIFCSLLLFSFSQSNNSQIIKEEYIISGTIRDEELGESLIGVVITNGKDTKGTLTDIYGNYVISVSPGEHVFIFSYVGYDKKEIKLNVKNDTVQDIFLKPSDFCLSEIIIKRRNANDNVGAVQSGVEKINVREIGKLPVLFGEKDILKSIQLLPGARSTGEGSSGIFVRGGNSDQNSILLDNIPLYNTSHLMGFFSIFNSDVIQNATFYKGSMPTQYGGRLSSVVDVRMMEGDMNKYNFNGSLGLITSKLTIDGPIQKGKSSFVISGFRTYADLMAKAIGAKDVENTSLYFYDLNLKLTFQLSKNDRLTISGYRGRDVLGINDLFQNSYGNISGGISWSKNFQKSLMSTSFLYNRYSTQGEEILDAAMKISSGITDYIIKQDFLYTPSVKQTWRIGYISSYHNIDPGKFRYEEGTGTTRILQNRYSWENGIYINHQTRLSDKLELLYGLRGSTFCVLGKGDFYVLDRNQNVIDTLIYRSGEVVKKYFNLEPRLSMNFVLSNNSSIKAFYGRTSQNLHLLSNTAFTQLSERWTSSSNYIKPQIADQISVGYFRNFSDNMFEFSIEAYYKDMKNQIDFKDNAQTYRKNDIETEILFGKGRAYGIEILFRKQFGKFTGWIGYTLSRSVKKIDGINNNNWYKATQDRTHDLSFVAMYELSKKWMFSATWVYYTGNAVTYPSGKYPIEGVEVPYYTERNGYRAPSYHRLDLAANRTMKKTQRFRSEISFGLYNAYGRENPYMIEFKTNKDEPSKLSTYQYSLFKFIPSLSWNFKF